ncbi:MAG: DUF1573 domain-containing protein [Desulfobacterales bacterium]|nr:DUF1573 domain-containing protein [Desulfobacterales bacterium]
MKKLFIYLLVVLGLVWGPVSATAQPAAVVSSPVYTFDPVPEGTHIDHTFIVKNTGTKLLRVLNVLPP